MRVLVVDNGSGRLAPLREALARLRQGFGGQAGFMVEVFGFPFVPSAFASAAAVADRVIVCLDRVPAGIDLPYRDLELAAVAALPVPVLGIGAGAAFLLEAHGGKVRGLEVRRPPAGWTAEGGTFRDGRGNVALAADADWRPALAAFLA